MSITERRSSSTRLKSPNRAASSDFNIGLGFLGTELVKCEQLTYAVSHSGRERGRQATELTLDNAGSDGQKTVESDRRRDLETGLSKLRILLIEHDVRVEQLLGLATGNEGEDDVPVTGQRLGEANG